MYVYDKENKMDIFKGDLTQFLLGYGVSVEHIDKMKAKILESRRDSYYDYPPLESPKTDYIKLVPLDKVIGTSRGTVGSSVYENVRIIHNGTRDSRRFTDCLSFLEKYPLEELRKSYENLCLPVIMDHYVDDDVYFVTDDGNHRTLTAMLVGAKYIKAKVTDAECDTIKKDRVLFCKKFEEKYRIVHILNQYNKSDFFFEDDNGIYKICGYPSSMVKEDLVSFLKRISEIIDNDTKKVNKIKEKSSIMQKIILCFEKNPRIKQYINIKYLSKEEKEYLLRNRHPIIWYNL